MTAHAGPEYEARYGRSPKHLFSIGFGLVISAVFLPAAVPAWQKLIVVGGFGGSAALLASMSLSRHPALGVTAAGVTIRPYPLRFRVIARYPWEDVVRIFIVRLERSKGQYVHIQLREGAAWASLSQAARPRARRALFFAGTGVAVNGWTLHPARLAAAVARFAPAVQVIDEATGSVVSPDEYR